MRNELDPKIVLSAFEKIRSIGEAKDGGYLLNGIKASTDFDGYTLFLEDQGVHLSFGFHNQYHYNYQRREDLDAFEKKLKRIAADR